MESKHIVAVKEPWWRSSCWNALKQMLTTNSCLDKLAAAWVDFTSHGDKPINTVRAKATLFSHL